MNYDINTPDGLANAVAWTNNTMGHLKTGGVWYVPRSGTTVIVRSHDPKRCRVLEVLPDPTVKSVLKAAGWTLVSAADDIAETRTKLVEEYASGFDSPNGDPA